ncbi:hypothetical protein EON63_08830 [archaeon]|nr:MAG: hypothetical protein EON63_08830 [archaeon]
MLSNAPHTPYTLYSTPNTLHHISTLLLTHATLMYMRHTNPNPNRMYPLMVYNSLTRTKVRFIPMHQKTVYWYQVCV